jgi:uncharacterized protein
VEIVLVVALALYNNVANLIPGFNAGLFVPINCLATAAVVGVGIVLLDLSLGEIGLVHLDRIDLLGGLLVGLVLTSPLYAALRWRRTAALIADERIGDLRGRKLAYQTLLRIPIGTALLEEIAFRGVLLAAFRPSGYLYAGIISSLVFGLWHISPTINLVRANKPNASTGTLVKTVAGAVVLTAAAGGALVWLRLYTDGLVAPWALHAALNSSATVAAVLAHRRLTADTGSRDAGTA